MLTLLQQFVLLTALYNLLCLYYNIVLDIIHRCSMPDNRLLKTLMLGLVEDERQQERPSQRWMDDILMWCDHSNGVIQMTEGHEVWRRFVASPYGPSYGVNINTEALLPIGCQSVGRCWLDIPQSNAHLSSGHGQSY